MSQIKMRLLTPFLAGFIFLSTSAHAVLVQDIQFVNDGKCFSKIKLRFENETSEELRSQQRDSDARFRQLVKGDQEICDDDGGFTIMLLFRSLQAFGSEKNVEREQLLSIEMSEWNSIKYSLLASLSVFSEILYTLDSQPPKGRQLSAELKTVLTHLKSIEENVLPKFNDFVNLGDTLEKFIGYPYSPNRMGLGYKSFPRSPDKSLSHTEFGIAEVPFTLPVSSRFRGTPTPKYECQQLGGYQFVFRSFEEACRQFMLNK